MSYFVLNLIFMLIWTLITAGYGQSNFFVGYVLGYFVLSLTRPFGKTRYFSALRSVLWLFCVFFYEMIISVGQVAWDVLTPRDLSDPDIIHVPLDIKGDLAIMILANMVSLTPGTLSLDVTPDKKFLIIHAMFAHDREAVIKTIKNRLEKPLMKIAHYDVP